MKLVFEDAEVFSLSKWNIKDEAVTGKIFKKYINKIIEKMINKFKKNKIKKVFLLLISLVVLLVQNPYSYALAQDIPQAPTAPTAPEVPASPEPTIAQPEVPEVPTAPTLEEFLSPSPTPTPVVATPTEAVSQTANSEYDDGGYTGTNNSSNNNTSPDQGSASNQSAVPETEGTGAQISDGGVGSVSLATGNADNTANIITTGNQNLSAVAGPSTGSGGSVVLNEANGSDPNNSGSVNSDSSANNYQTNSATVVNNLNQNTDTGNNSASKNTGGDVNLATGDANTTGTIVNSVNTNVNGMAIYEFNVSDDHMGDFVLNFDESSCLSGCGGATSTAVNSGNGAGSTNDANVFNNSEDNSFQINDATLTNNMYLTSNTGDNQADKNTGGNSNIETGDANVEGNILNFVNNNIDGNVVYAVVNVYGDLIGDIILPDGTVLTCCAGNTTALNSGNGSDSENTASVNQSTSNNVNQFNNADIQNNLILNAETGENETDRNTNGNNNIETGDTNIIAQVLNVANTNIVGGNMWLVIVNEAGKWIGRIMGAPEGQNFAGSDGFEFDVNENGEVTAMNTANGDGSTNTSNVTGNNNTNTTQVNNATIVNNVTLDANTGGNSASRNTGGDSSIQSGDANVIANIVNFVNNNIVGTGKLFVTVVNVFGSWLGNFVGPGQHQQETQVLTDSNASNATGGHSGNNQNDQNNVSSTGEQSTETTVAGTINDKKNTFKQKVYASTNLEGGDGAGNVLSIEDSSEELAIAGDTTDNTPVAGKKVIKINLAFFTPLIPLGIWFVLKRRKLAKVTASAPLA